jgi:four helix bundle protein
MVTEFSDVEVLREAEGIADDVWKLTLQWNGYARDVVGKQLARAADSVGANIAEAFGRYHFGEKLNFLYYARGSL